MKKIKKIILLLLVSLFIVACGNSKSDEGLAAMIVELPQGDPFITAAYNGVKELAEDEGIESKIIEALDKSEFSEQIRAMAEAGANPVYVLWDDLAAEAIKLAPEFPETKFIVVDSYTVSDLDNVKTIVVEPQDASFIAGYVASKTTETDKVAWIGSMETTPIKRFKAGFEAGVEYGDPDVDVETVYLGTAEDPNKGAEMAKQLIDTGVDVIMHSANQSGLGVIRAGEEMDIKIIGVDEWQGSINEEVVFWSALKDIGGATYNAGKSVLDGTFDPGIEVYNASTGIKLYDERDFNKLSEELQNEVLEVEKLLKEGEIEITLEQ